MMYAHKQDDYSPPPTNSHITILPLNESNSTIEKGKKNVVEKFIFQDEQAQDVVFCFFYNKMPNGGILLAHSNNNAERYTGAD